MSTLTFSGYIMSKLLKNKKINSNFQNRKCLVKISDCVVEINAKDNHDKCDVLFAYGKKRQEKLSYVIISKNVNNYEIIGGKDICDFNNMYCLIEYIENKVEKCRSFFYALS